MKQLFNKSLGWLSSHIAGKKLELADFFRPVHIKLISGLALLFNLVSWVLAFISWFGLRQSPDKQIILHRTTVFGIDQIGAAFEVFYLPGFGLLVLIANLILAYAFARKKDNISLYLLIGSAIVVNVFLIMALATIYKLNFGK